MAPRSLYPDYPHDEEKYKAACAWLLNSRHLPVAPLPEMLYEAITSDMVHKDGAWVFSAKSAAESTEKAKKPPEEAVHDIPRRAFEQVLKQLYRGMHMAYAQGLTDGPHGLGMAHVEGYMGNFLVGLDPQERANVYFTNLPQFRETLATLEKTMRKNDQVSCQQVKDALASTARLGFQLQCHAHFLNHHVELYKGDREAFFAKQIVFGEEQLQQLDAAKRSRP